MKRALFRVISVLLILSLLLTTQVTTVFAETVSENYIIENLVEAEASKEANYEYKYPTLGDVVENEGHKYQIFKVESDDWNKVETYFESLGGHLATITSAEEDTFVYNYMKKCGVSSAYFGLTDFEKEKVWKWVTGEQYSYSNWAAGEPNNQGYEDYAMYYYKSGQKWNDGSGKGECAYICEWDISDGEDISIPNYEQYELQIYSWLTSCNIGLGDSFKIRPALVNGEEVLQNEKGYSFVIEDTGIIDITETTYDEYGPIINLTGKKEGETKLQVTHIASGKQVTIRLAVGDRSMSYNISDLKDLSDGTGIFNAEIFMDEFQVTKLDTGGYNVSFYAYNGLDLVGGVEIYDKKNNLIGMEKIKKFERYQTNFVEVFKDAWNLIDTTIKWDFSSFKNSMYSEQTKIEVWVPDGGYIVVSNNFFQSVSVFLYNTLDLGFFAYSEISSAIKSEETLKVVINGADKHIVKQCLQNPVLWQSIVTKYQEKMQDYLNEEITTTAASEVIGNIVNDSTSFYNDLDIDLKKLFVESAGEAGVAVAESTFEELSGPAGNALKAIFKIDKYLNRFMQIVGIYKTRKVANIKVCINESDDFLISDDVIVENKKGKSLANNTLKVTDITNQSVSQYVIRNLSGYSQIKIMDITMYKDEQEVQPDGIICIKIPLPVNYDKDRCSVYRAETNGTFTNMNAVYKNGYMVFETEHLSTYMLVELNREQSIQENKEKGTEKNQIKKLSISAPSKKLAAGKKVKLTLKATPANATNKAVTWKTSNKKYATVNKNGKLTLKKAGAGKTVTITAKAKDGSGKKATIKIKIMKHAVKSIKIKAPSKTLKAGKSMKLETTIKTTGKKVNKTLKWSSSNTKYATVSKSGKVKAKKAGKGKTVTITAKATDGSNKKAKVKIKIK